MPDPYSTSTTDSPACKRLFCGRSNDLTQVLNALARGQSVALFGERRIGKTLLLFVLRDIVNGDVAHYEQDLLDGTLRAGLAMLRGKLTQCTPVFLSLHDLNGHDARAFGTLLLTRLQAHGFLHSFALVTAPGQAAKPSMEPGDLTQLFAMLSHELQGHRLLLLFDEIEVLLDDTFDNATQVFRNLRSAIQTYPEIRFVFAGAEDWHRRIKERTSPLVGNVKPFYLTAATPADIENYLLEIPLHECFPDAAPALLATMIQQTMDWTGGKPYYVQEVGSRMALHSDFGERWADEITRRVEEDIAGQLANFYDEIDPAAQRILGLLAHHPGLTMAGMARRLGVSQPSVSSRVEDLVALDKVRMEGGEYQIVGTLIAEWGRTNRDLPGRSLWPQRLRWIGTCLASAAALGAYLYTHPSTQVKQFPFADGHISLMFPASVEAGEQGALAVAVRNTAKTALSEIHVNLFADRIDFQKEGSSRLTIKDLGNGESRHQTLSYSVHGRGTPGAVPVEVAVHCAERSIASQFTAEWHIRTWPLQRWWAAISSFFLLLSVLCKWDSIKQLIEPLRALIGGKQLA